MNNINELSELGKKIRTGLDLYHKRLVADKIKNDEDIIFSTNGEIVRMKASEFVKIYPELI